MRDLQGFQGLCNERESISQYCKMREKELDSEENVPSAGSSLSTCFLSSASASAAWSKGSKRDQSNPSAKKNVPVFLRSAWVFSCSSTRALCSESSRWKSWARVVSRYCKAEKKRAVISNPVCRVPRLTRGLAGRDSFFLRLEPSAAALHLSLGD